MADAPVFIDPALSVYRTEVARAIRAQEGTNARLAATRAGVADTLAALRELPARLSHSAMVPLGRHAFFPGRLVRTNEMLVALGAGYHVEVSAAAAQGILQRRLEELDRGLDKGAAQLRSLRARLDVIGVSLRDEQAAAAGGAFEIRQSLEESDALLTPAPQAARGSGGVSAGSEQAPGERVRSAAGYSYMRRPGSQPQPAAQQPDEEDAALAARLAELVRLEEAQEALQQEVDMHAPLGSIAEGVEEPPAAAAAAAAAGGARAAAASGGSSSAGWAALAAAAQLAQLDGKPDSDDEETGSPPPPPPPPLQQPRQQQPQPLGAVLEHAQPGLGQQGQLRAAGWGGSRPLTSALKKGFLGASPARPASSSSSSNSTSSTSSSSRPAQRAGEQQLAAFTGQVVERPATAPPAVVERLPGTPHPPTAASLAPPAAASKPVSRFKQRRQGQ